jgi:hypothetical protein
LQSTGCCCFGLLLGVSGLPLPRLRLVSILLFFGHSFDSRVMLNHDCKDSRDGSKCADAQKQKATADIACAPGYLIKHRRRHQPRKPPLAKIKPGRPPPAMGAGTGSGPWGATNAMSALVVVLPTTPLALMVKRSVTE